MDAETAETSVSPGHLTVWRVFGLSYLFDDRPQPYWEAASQAGPGRDDRLSVFIGEVPNELLESLKDWRAQIPLLLRAQVGQEPADATKEDLDAEFHGHR